MMMTRSRMHQIVWGSALAAALAAFAALTLSVHAVRNEVLLTDINIVALKKKKHLLETEFQARASQHQLARWNRVDLGFVAPRADQYLDTSKQLAALGQPLGPGAPSPIRVARADPSDRAALASRAMISPVSGKPITLVSMQAPDGARAVLADAFGDFLIQASPIRQAKAQTGAGFTAEVAE